MGRTPWSAPWSAAGPLAGLPGRRRGLILRRSSGTRASRADEGVRPTKQTILKNFAITLCLAFIVPALHAQNVPHAAYVLPAGGQQGATIDVAVGGQFLQNAADVYVSGAGVEATVAGHTRPMNGNEAATLRDRMQELQKQPMNAAVWDEMTQIRVKLLTFNSNRLISSVLAETLTLHVTISPGAAPGKRELRVASPGGLSNPLIFCVGQLQIGRAHV